MRVLIVGCGYAGLTLGAELARGGHEVFGIRRNAGSEEEELRRASIQPLIADISIPEALKVLPREFDWVVNTVASTGGGATDYRRTYLEGTRNLLNWLAPSVRAFVYTSSTGVYAQNDGSLVTEESPAKPDSATSRVLIETEQLLLNAAREQEFPAMVLRCAGIYGPDRGYWLRQFLSGEARMEGDGNRWLNMIHRDDVVNAIISALEHGTPGEVYNVVDDEPVRQRTVFAWLAERLRKPLPPGSATSATPGRRAATDKRVSNQKLRLALRCNLKYPTFREGYAAELARLGY